MDSNGVHPVPDAIHNAAVRPLPIWTGALEPRKEEDEGYQVDLARCTRFAMVVPPLQTISLVRMSLTLMVIR